jgi:serine/threonine-protein kinase
MDILVAHLHEPPKPLREMNPKTAVPPALERVVMRCLDKHPDRRYADMQQLIDTLRALASELGMTPESSWAGASVRPDAAPSGLRNRPSDAPAPRVAAQDLAGPRPGAASVGPPKAALLVIAGSAVAAAVILGIALWFSGANAKSVTSLPPPAPSPVAPTPPAEPQPESNTPDMVISPEEASAPPSVRIAVSSVPPGAQIFVRGKHMGVTPASFDWQDPQAKVGGSLVMVLKREGYANHTIRRTIDGAPLTLAATLTAAPAGRRWSRGRRLRPRQPSPRPTRKRLSRSPRATSYAPSRIEPTRSPPIVR